MTEYDNTNRGSIWKNEKKTTDSHPDFTGTLNVDGVEFYVSAWKRKEGANPKAPALSFTVKPKEEQKSISQRSMLKGQVPNKYAAATGAHFPGDDMDGDAIPF